jgi:hypothetical protein
LNGIVELEGDKIPVPALFESGESGSRAVEHRGYTKAYERQADGNPENLVNDFISPNGFIGNERPQQTRPLCSSTVKTGFALLLWAVFFSRWFGILVVLIRSCLVNKSGHPLNA